VKGTWREGSLAGALKFWRQTSLCIGAPLGNLEWGSSTRDFEKWLKGAQGMELLSCRGSPLKVSREGFFAWDLGGYVTKAPDMNISLHRGPLRLRGTWNQEGVHIPGILSDE